MTERRMSRRSEGIFLRWAPNRSRSDDLAAGLGAELVALRWQDQRPVVVPFRYLIQFVQTLVICFRRKPRVVFTQYTQPFCSLAALVYTAIAGGRLVPDVHNTPFVDRIWRIGATAWINRLILRHATLNLVHNHGVLRHAVEELKLAGRFAVLRDPIPDFDPRPHTRLPSPSVIVISSFAQDEPVGAILQAAAQTPEAHYYITGNDRNMDRSLRSSVPPNVTLTGFLPDRDYDALLCSATVAMALSSYPFVLTRACHEAIGAGIPFIATDAPVANEYLNLGTVFVTHTADSIAAGVREAIARREDLHSQMVRLKQIRQGEYRRQLADVRDMVGLPDPGRTGWSR